MINSSASHLDELELLTYLDGAAAEALQAHVDQCRSCQQRAGDLARFQRQLTATLHRVECPSPQELGEYHLGVLPERRTHELRRHVDGCPHCSREVVQLRSFLTDLAPELEPSLMELAAARVKVLVARLVSGLEAGPALAPAMAGVRGTEGRTPVYEADDIQMTVQVEPDPGTADRLQLLGLVLGAEEGDWRAHLWCNEQRVAAVSIDSLGNVVFPGLEPGCYDLVIEGPGVEIHVQDLEVDPV